MIPIEVRHGALLSDPSKPRLELAPHLQTDSYPSACDWLGGVAKWPMYGNDTMGDCEVAMAAHIIGATSFFGQGAEVTLRRSTVVNTYSALSGYDPKTGENDNGVATQDLMDYWRKTGIGGHKILAFASLPVPSANKDAYAFMKAAVHVFGALAGVISVYDQTENEWQQGKPWTPVADTNKGFMGFHAIHIGKYNGKGLWDAVTWGSVQPVRKAFFDQNLQEVWVPITKEWFNKAGKTPTGLDLKGLGDNLARLTGEPNPFI